MSNANLPELPPLPHIFHGITLLEQLMSLASEELDPDFQRVMDIRVLYMLGLGSWLKHEIDLRIARNTDPARMLASIRSQSRCRIALTRFQAIFAASGDGVRLARLGHAYYFADNEVHPTQGPSDTVSMSIAGTLTHSDRRYA